MIYSWRNWVIRGIFTWIMICGFALIIYMGPLALMMTVCTYIFLYILVAVILP